ncbi:hypothetical protein CEY02_18515 [Bacillus pumilus]|uniref:Uncharacterized protein n=1 Tax=Bacillus pumilus TaxID=1408 RepID=A0A2A5IN67_BACPU|nr:hypothetical protein [Bacillus pumilus]PCK18546.1 hypothetical protein CEY02_18515 [Bacillus pumilus]
MDLISKLSDDDLIKAYGEVINELKKRGIIRSKNLLGDLGEYLAINQYCNTIGLPNLQPAPIGTQNIDAISVKGERYSIKSTTGKVTGVFYGLNEPDSKEPELQKFEYIIVVKFNEDYVLEKIIELNWTNFLKNKKWHSRMRAWNLTITQKLINDSKIIYVRN